MVRVPVPSVAPRRFGGGTTTIKRVGGGGTVGAGASDLGLAATDLLPVWSAELAGTAGWATGQMVFSPTSGKLFRLLALRTDDAAADPTDNPDLLSDALGTDVLGAADVDRSDFWTVYQEGGIPFFSTSTPQALVEGSEALNTTNAFAFGATETTVGKRIVFQAVTAVKLGSMQVAMQTGSVGTWKARGSNDGTTWTDLSADVVWTDGATWSFTNNPTPYLYYALEGVSGSYNAGPFIGEMYFTDSLDVPVTSWEKVAGFGGGVSETQVAVQIAAGLAGLEPDRYVIETIAGAQTLGAAHLGKLLLLDTAPTFGPIAADHIGRFVTLVNRDAAPMTVLVSGATLVAASLDIPVNGTLSAVVVAVDTWQVGS